MLRPDAPTRAECLRGACLVFRREALEGVGLFDEQFFMFAEEIDLFRRLNTAGWTAWVVPGLTAQHAGGKSSRGHENRAVSSRFRRQSYRSMCGYYRKHHAWPAAVVFRAILAARVASRLPRALVAWVLGRSDVWWLREHARCLSAVLQPCASNPREPRLAPSRRSEEREFGPPGTRGVPTK